MRPKKTRLQTPMGGSGQYLYVLVVGNQTVEVFDVLDNDALVATISLAAGKAFISIHYRPVDETVIVAGTNSWADVIDANPASGTFNTVIRSVSTNWSASPPFIVNYLPPPIDLFSTGGSSLKGDLTTTEKYRTKDGRYFGVHKLGHSNTPNIKYHHHIGAIQLGRIFYSLVPLKRTGYIYPYRRYNFERHPTMANGYPDLYQSQYWTLVFGNFTVAITLKDVFIMSNDYCDSPIIIFKTNILTTFNSNNRGIMEFCPNAPNRLFIVQGYNTNLNMEVLNFDYANKDVTREGALDRTSHVATGELCARDIMWNPANGKLYVQGWNITNNAADVNKIHRYNPAAVDIASMYEASITVGDTMVGPIASADGCNKMCMNRVRNYDHPNIFI